MTLLGWIRKEMRKEKIRKEKGIALVSSLSMISTVIVLTIGFMANGIAEIHAVRNFEARMSAFHLAEGALDQTIVRLRTNPSYSGLPSTASSNSRNIGQYQTTVTPSQTNPNIYTIQAKGQVLTSTGGSIQQERNITAVVELGPAPKRPPYVFAEHTIQVSGNVVTDSYNSNNGTYQPQYAGQKGHIGSNRADGNTISLSGNVQINGDAIIGPGGDPNTAIVLSGNSNISGTQYAASSGTTLDPATVPGGVSNSGGLSVNGNNTVTLPSGTYHYTSLTIEGNGRLNTTGQTTIYVSGDVSIAGNGITTAQNLPPNLTIKVVGDQTVTVSGNGNFYGSIYAPQARVNIYGNGELFGAVTGDSLAMSGDGKIHCDEALDDQGGGSATNRMKSWQEL
ncbi:MAG: hypothetical protein HY584_03490 [Candidatus Omnitrophica bacterium]|nr:hypothetical protein [Candidatus Omnitrophota bacterium]